MAKSKSLKLVLKLISTLDSDLIILKFISKSKSLALKLILTLKLNLILILKLILFLKLISLALKLFSFFLKFKNSSLLFIKKQKDLKKSFKLKSESRERGGRH